MQLYARLRNSDTYVTCWIRNPLLQKKVAIWDLTASKEHTFRLDKLVCLVEMWGDAKLDTAIWTYASANFVRQLASSKGVLPKVYDRVIVIKPLRDSYHRCSQYVDGFPELDSLEHKFQPPIADMSCLATIQHWNRHNSTHDHLLMTPNSMIEFLPHDDEESLHELNPAHFNDATGSAVAAPAKEKTPPAEKKTEQNVFASPKQKSSKKKSKDNNWVMEKGIIAGFSPSKRKPSNSPQLKQVRKSAKRNIFSESDKEAVQGDHVSDFDNSNDSSDSRAVRGRSSSLSVAPHTKTSESSPPSESPLTGEKLIARAEAQDEPRPSCPDDSVLIYLEGETLAKPQVTEIVEDKPMSEGLQKFTPLRPTQSLQPLHPVNLLKLKNLKEQQLKIKQEICDREFQLQFAKIQQRRGNINPIPGVKVEPSIVEVITLSDSEENVGEENAGDMSCAGDDNNDTNSVKQIKVEMGSSSAEDMMVSDDSFEKLLAESDQLVATVSDHLAKSRAENPLLANEIIRGYDNNDYSSTTPELVINEDANNAMLAEPEDLNLSQSEQDFVNEKEGDEKKDDRKETDGEEEEGTAPGPNHAAAPQ